MTVARPPCRLAALGVVNALGSDAESVWRGLVAGEPSRLSWNDELVPGRRLLVGAVSRAAAGGPARRSRATAAATTRWRWRRSTQIEAPLREAIASRGAARVGVVLGTSTSGVVGRRGRLPLPARCTAGSIPPSTTPSSSSAGSPRSWPSGSARAAPPTRSRPRARRARVRSRRRARCSRWASATRSWPARPTRCAASPRTASARSRRSARASPTRVARTAAGSRSARAPRMFLLTPEPGGIQLTGAGESSEAHHMSAPDPSGAGAEAAMRGALDDAGLAPEAIAYLNLHGTGHAAERRDGVPGGRARVRHARCPSARRSRSSATRSAPPARSRRRSAG